MTAPAIDPAATVTDHDLFHWVCECDWDLALCGLDVSGQPVGNPDDDTMCVVCNDLLHEPCTRCGSVV